MTKALAQTYTIAHTYRRSITTALLMGCIVSALFYAANLYRVISHTVALQHITQEAKELNASVQALDAQYLGISKNITPDTLDVYGYGQAEVSAFISRASLGRVALAGHEL
ncbi:MAG: hypothetical protein AAB365_01145 [Patescibacteria group bacterium]